jgi:hypothetical protein
MHEAYAGNAKNAKSERSQSGCRISVSDTLSPIHHFITELFIARKPRKTWTLIAETLGLKEHAAKHRAAVQRAYSVEELQVMLQTDDGLDLLVELMGDAKPEWWWWANQVMEVADIKRQRFEGEQRILKLETTAPAGAGARRRIKGALDANRTINAGIDRAEVALGLQRPDMARVVDSDIGQVSRSGGVAVAGGGRAQAGRSGGARR